MRKFRRNRRGLAWVWVVGFVLTIPFCALIYWTLDYPMDIIIAQVSGIYTFQGTMLSAWTLVHAVVSYMLAFTLIFAVIWVIVNSKSPGVYY